MKALSLLFSLFLSFRISELSANSGAKINYFSMINLFIYLTPSTEKPINNVKHAISHGMDRWLMSVFTVWAERGENNGKTLSRSRHTCQTNTSPLARREQTSFYTPLFYSKEFTAALSMTVEPMDDSLNYEGRLEKRSCNDLVKDVMGLCLQGRPQSIH